jgi:hypothetical protein
MQLRAKTVSIAFTSNYFNYKPMAPFQSLIVKNNGLLIVTVHGNVERTIIVQITKSHASCCL